MYMIDRIRTRKAMFESIASSHHIQVMNYTALLLVAEVLLPVSNIF